jgi:4a-hydroxytetrahydrobiopterin dehydratase
MARTLRIYTPDEITARLEHYASWSLGEDGQLQANLMFKNFAQVMFFVNALAYLAETANHHPDLLIHGWKNLRISLMTHDQGGITDLDFDLIRQIDALPRPKS